MKVKGSEKEATALIPAREFLIILKLHSGRLTDFRDVAALSKNLNFELIGNFIWRGRTELVKKNIKKLASLLNDKGFTDSFKGVFMGKKYDVDIEAVKSLKEILVT